MDEVGPRRQPTGMSGELAELKTTIGKRIQQRREESGMTQESLAFEAGLTPSYLSQVEAGKRNPSIAVLFRLCSALDLHVSELFKP